MVDEVLLNRREDSERLKNLSTTLSYKVEAKGKDRDEIAFFAKFVLCSNNEIYLLSLTRAKHVIGYGRFIALKVTIRISCKN